MFCSAAMVRCVEMVAEEEDDDEYAKLVRRMNPPRYDHLFSSSLTWQVGVASLGLRRLDLLTVLLPPPVLF